MNTQFAPLLVHCFLTAGFLSLALTGARAQDNGVIWTPYGNIPAGARPVNLSPSAPYTTNPFNKNTQTPTQAFARRPHTSPNPYQNPYQSSIFNPYYPGNTFYPGVPVYSGGIYGPGDFTIPIYGDPSSPYSSPYFGGYPVAGPVNNVLPGASMPGAILASPDPKTAAQQVNAILQNTDTNSGEVTAPPVNTRVRPASQTPPAQVSETGRLSKQVKVKYDSEEGMSFNWRGDTGQITKLSVTLLARYGVTLQTLSTNGAQTVTFAPGKDLSSARHYKVDVVYNDGTTASYTAPLPFSIN